MAIKDEFIAELKQESTLTRKILAKVPFDKKEWKPHEKSMTIGRLATHIAENTGWINRILANDVFDFPSNFKPPYTASSTEEVLQIFQANLDAAIAILEKTSDEGFQEKWTLTRGEHVILELPRKIAIRGWAFSHQVHHRGQLSVYLRLLDIPVPGMYGPSADEK